MNPIIVSYGLYTNGPFIGQYKKQALALEYGTPGGIDTNFTIQVQDQFTVFVMNALAAYPWTMGALWWEPTYANNNWYGSCGSLYRVGSWSSSLSVWTNFVPIDTIPLWGSYAAARGATPNVAITQNSTNVVISWPLQGTLMQSTNVTGPWTINSPNSPLTNVITGTNQQMFFRVQFQ